MSGFSAMPFSTPGASTACRRNITLYFQRASGVQVRSIVFTSRAISASLRTTAVLSRPCSAASTRSMSRSSDRTFAVADRNSTLPLLMYVRTSCRLSASKVAFRVFIDTLFLPPTFTPRSNATNTPERSAREAAFDIHTHRRAPDDADPFHAAVVVADELDRLAAIGPIRDDEAVGAVERDGPLSGSAAAAGAILHDEFSAVGADDVRVARARIGAEIGRGLGLRRQRLRRGQRLNEAAVRDGLVRRVGNAEVRLQRFTFDVLNQPPAAVRVREDRDREVALGHDLEQQDVPAERAAVAERTQRPDAADVPRKTDVVVGPLLVGLHRPHLLQRRALQHAVAVRGGAVAHVEP